MWNKNHPLTVRLALALIGVMAVFWVSYGLLAALGGIRPLIDLGVMRWLVPALALGAGVCLAGLAILLWKRVRFVFPLVVILLSIVAVTSILDEVGVSDVTSMLVAAAALVLLLKDRRWYLGKADPPR